MAGVVVRRDAERSVVGTAVEVSGRLERLRATGRLAEATPMRPIMNRPGLWISIVRLSDEPIRSPVRWRRGLVIGGAVAGGLTGLAVGGYFLVAALAGTVASVSAPLTGIGLIVLVLWVLAGRTGHCPGLHCPGCKCGRH